MKRCWTTPLTAEGRSATTVRCSFSPDRTMRPRYVSDRPVLNNPQSRSGPPTAFTIGRQYAHLDTPRRRSTHRSESESWSGHKSPRAGPSDGSTPLREYQRKPADGAETRLSTQRGHAPARRPPSGRAALYQRPISLYRGVVCSRAGALPGYTARFDPPAPWAHGWCNALRIERSGRRSVARARSVAAQPDFCVE